MACAYEDLDEGTVKHRLEQLRKKGRVLLKKDSVYKNLHKIEASNFDLDKRIFQGPTGKNIVNSSHYLYPNQSRNEPDLNKNEQNSYFFKNEISYEEPIYPAKGYSKYNSKEFLENVDGYVIKRNLFNRSLSADDLDKALNRQSNFISSYNDSLAELPMKSFIVKHQIPWHSVTRCYYCGNNAFSSDQITVGNNTWHKWCLKCDQCLVTLSSEKDVTFYKDVIYCVHCYNDIITSLNKIGRFNSLQRIMESKKEFIKYPLRSRHHKPLNNAITSLASNKITYNNPEFVFKHNSDLPNLLQTTTVSRQQYPSKSILKNNRLYSPKNIEITFSNVMFSDAFTSKLIGDDVENYNDDVENEFNDYNRKLKKNAPHNTVRQNENNVIINMRNRLKNKSYSTENLEDSYSASYNYVLESACKAWVEKNAPLNPPLTIRQSPYVDKNSLVPSYYEYGTLTLKKRFARKNEHSYSDNNKSTKVTNMNDYNENENMNNHNEKSKELKTSVINDITKKDDSKTITIKEIANDINNNDINDNVIDINNIKVKTQLNAINIEREKSDKVLEKANKITDDLINDSQILLIYNETSKENSPYTNIDTEASNFYTDVSNKISDTPQHPLEYINNNCIKVLDQNTENHNEKNSQDNISEFIQQEVLKEVISIENNRTKNNITANSLVLENSHTENNITANSLVLENNVSFEKQKVYENKNENSNKYDESLNKDSNLMESLDKNSIKTFFPEKKEVKMIKNKNGERFMMQFESDPPIKKILSNIIDNTKNQPNIVIKNQPISIIKSQETDNTEVVYPNTETNLYQSKNEFYLTKLKKQSQISKVYSENVEIDEEAKKFCNDKNENHGLRNNQRKNDLLENVQKLPRKTKFLISIKKKFSKN
ncbi:GATA zinc finger domain-containing protein 14 [Hydra vulgaris]|uniref:GATA zinc finger domain-containing protein 14 n=1 Tax=Hydra vulgaris TaxID=6087 RepID=A0ABM4BBL9_HYDVU